MIINLSDEKLILQRGKCWLLPVWIRVKSAEKNTKIFDHFIPDENKNVEIMMTIFDIAINSNDDNKQSTPTELPMTTSPQLFTLLWGTVL